MNVRSIIAALSVAALVMICYFCVILRGERINRKADILVGKHYLKEDFKQYLEHGMLPKNDNPYSDVWLNTNIVEIGKTQYQGCIAGRFGPRFAGGILLMTTNHVFIWQDGKHPPKIIGDNYNPPFFPARF